MTVKTLPAHGERRTYLRGCRCTPCATAQARYCKHYRAKTIRRPIRVDATPVRQKIQAWRNQGYSYNQIAVTVGKASGAIVKIASGQPTLAPHVAAQIMRAPTPTGTPTKATTDATGTIRRGRALVAIGYPIYQIAPRIPVAANHLGRLLDGEVDTVSVTVAQGMAALYKTLVGRPGPSEYAVRHARRHNWHGPLAWDDIDNPNEQPEIDDTKTAHRYLAIAEDAEWLERTQGYTREHAAARLGVTRDNLQASITRARKKQQHNELEIAA